MEMVLIHLGIWTVATNILVKFVKAYSKICLFKKTQAEKGGHIEFKLWQWKNLPNFISFLRVILAFIFPFVSSQEQIVILVCAMLTEVFDGAIARLFGWTSRFGEILDPVADKIFFLSVCMTFIFNKSLSWTTWILLSTRDIGVFLTPLILLFFGKARKTKLVPARKLGKITTVLQYIALFSLVFLRYIPNWLIVLTSIVGIFASIHYIFLVTRFYTR